MSSPVEGVFAWSVFNEEKGFDFNGHILRTAKGAVMVDPPPLTDAQLASIEKAGLKPDALVITNRNHLRARDQIVARWNTPTVLHEAEVADAGIVPERTVKDGDEIFGLRVVHLPGKSPGEIALLWPEKRVIVLGDALIAPHGAFKTVPADKQDDPARLRRSLERLRHLDFDIALVGDGTSCHEGAKEGVVAFLDAA